MHHAGVRSSLQRLEELLHPDFHEVGRSGRAYDRGTVVQWLTNQAIQRNVRSSEFKMGRLAEDCALLTYRSVHLQDDGTETLTTLRSSVWQADADTNGLRWRLRYHQGTPAAT